MACRTLGLSNGGLEVFSRGTTGVFDRRAGHLTLLLLDISVNSFGGIS